MNKILLGVNALLIAAVIFLFVKVSSLDNAKPETAENTDSTASAAPQKKTETSKPIVQVGSTPTGKIAYVNIDELNEKSLEIGDLVAEAKRRRDVLEAGLENLNMQYQKKVEDYQMSAKAGLTPPNEMQMKEKEILTIEKDAQNKQLQMENLTVDIGEKNAAFQKNVKTFLIKWNQGRYDYILSYSEAAPNMLLGNTALEVTKEVIEQLNSEYKLRKGKK